MMTISKERIERAARAMCDDAYGPDYYDDCDDENVRGRYNEYALAALEADAPESIAAKIEGMREVQAEVEALTYPRSIPAGLHLGSAVAAWREHTREARERAIEVSVNIDARIAELRAEMGKAGAPTAATDQGR